ncbi:MAG TPA: matrixin family metalloprotease, partial [Thermoanaerobaculia bacterium]|nr:matrixin family metalloprotease [Thermoanaerobaculia bacterium]
MIRRLGTAALILAATPAFAAVHLLYIVNGSPVAVSWPASSFPIRYVVDSSVASAFPPGVIERAVDDWTVIPGAQVSFEDGGVMNGIKAGKDGQNSITFVDGLFKNQNFLAVTTNWYDDTGHMAEADVQIDPSVVHGGYNLELLVEHEFGHVLGLDHSGVLSSIMYPFVGSGGVTALDTDDEVSIANLYPERGKTADRATLSGRVMGDNGGIFAAQVVAMDGNGSPVATALTDQQGHFEIDGVPPGTYQ